MPSPRPTRHRLRGAVASLAPPVPLQRGEIGVLALLATAAFSQGWMGNVFTHTLAYTRGTFGLSDQRIADVETVVRATALVALLLSWWADRRGRRGPLLLAFAILPVANLATAFAPSLTVFAGLQGVARIGTIALGSLGLLVIAEEVNPAVRGYASGIFGLGLSLGTGFGLIITPAAQASDEAWRALFGVSALPVLLLPVLVFRLRESRAFRPGTHTPLGAALKRGLARRLWPMAGLSFAVAAFIGPAAAFINPRLVNDLGWAQGGASLLLVLASTPAVPLGLLAGGRAADLIGRRPTELVAILVGVSGGVVVYFSEAGWAMGLGIFLSILGSSAFAPAFTAQRAELFPTAMRATAGAWLVNAGILGGLAGFLAGRFAIGAWGVPVTVAGLGGLLLSATALLLLLPETRGADLVDSDPPAIPPGAAGD
ncbi:MAG: MFS transporter [Actinomycetota bacterium]